MFSSDYIAAVVLIIVGILKTFGIQVGSDAISGIITGIVALYIAVKKYQTGQVSLFGLKK